MIERAKAFYDGMKEEHHFLTGHDDYIFAAMLGLSDLDVETGVARMEQLYDALKPEFLSGNGVQAMAQVLVLSEKPSEALTRICGLRDAFCVRHLRLDKEYTLSSLGVLSLLPGDIGTIVDDVTEAYELLRTKKGFGHWTITKQELLLFSASLVAFKSIDELKNSVLTTTISTSLTNIIIAQQTAIAVTAASSAAAASASAASN